MPGRGHWALHADPPYEVAAEFGNESSVHLRHQQPELRRPGGGVGDEQQLAVTELFGSAVRGDLRADEFGPAAEQRALPSLVAPAAVVDQPPDQ